jgi:TPR repeat protein
MYSNGLGVPQDYKEAVRLYRLSAEQGDAKAQSNLGNNYALGEGVPQDYVSAHMWFNLSSSQGITNAIKGRNFLEKQMTPSQIEKAQELARNWKPTSK